MASLESVSVANVFQRRSSTPPVYSPLSSHYKILWNGSPRRPFGRRPNMTDQVLLPLSFRWPSRRVSFPCLFRWKCFRRGRRSSAGRSFTWTGAPQYRSAASSGRPRSRRSEYRVARLRPHALHPGAIQGKEGIKFCSVA